MSIDFKAQWQQYKTRVQQQLESAFKRHLPDQTTRLAQAMRYSSLNNGKRFRAMLVYASGQSLGAKKEDLDSAAVAIELIHAYSLIHDDLPAMDNDDLRRGEPSCHIQFDEHTAILAGDALQSMAFEVLAGAPNQALLMIQRLSRASGDMVRGQSLDMMATGQKLTLTSLQHIHESKTGALIRAALVMGAMSAQAKEQDIVALDDYGRHIGLAFQVTDDVLDQTQSSAKLGKKSGADMALNKNTYPALMGLESSQQYAAKLVKNAHQSLGKIQGDSVFLQQLADFTIRREF